MIHRAIAGALACFCILWVTSTNASAWLRFKNATNKTLYLAISIPEIGCGDGWGTWGWYEIPPGQTREIIRGNLQWDRYYFYASDFAGSSTVGPYTTCVHPVAAFHQCPAGCPSTWRRVGFTEILTPRRNHTHTIN